jgi:hypothetical protein
MLHWCRGRPILAEGDMGAFNSTLSDYSGYSVLEFEASGEGGTHEHRSTVDGQVTAAVVVAEGDIAELGVTVGDQRLAETDDDATTHVRRGRFRSLFVKLNPARGAELGVRAAVRAGVHAKITVLFLRRAARDYWHHVREQLNCEGCKRLVRVLVSAALAGLGYVDLPTDMAGDASEWLLEQLGAIADGDYSRLPDAVRGLLEHIDKDAVRSIFKALHAVWEVVQTAANGMDWLLTRVCQKLGFCT